MWPPKKSITPKLPISSTYVCYIFYASSWKVCNLGAFHPQPFSIYHCERTLSYTLSQMQAASLFSRCNLFTSGAAKGEVHSRGLRGWQSASLFICEKNPNERTHFLLWVERDDASWGCIRIAGITGCCCDLAFFVAARGDFLLCTLVIWARGALAGEASSRAWRPSPLL